MNHSIKMFLSSGRFLPQLIKKFNKPNLDKEYLDYINSGTVWKNDFESSLPICAVYTHIHSFLDKCEINDGNAVDSDGKIRKVLFLGYDGMRADTAQKMLEMKNAYNKDLPSFTNEFGGISEVAKLGGIYLAYCGGYTDTLYQQSSDTAAGWTAQFTGKWGLNNGVKENDDTKKLSAKTVILEYAEKGLATSINFDWEPLFTVNLKSEINYVMAHSELGAKYIANCKRKSACNTDFDNFIAVDSLSVGIGDTFARDCTLNRINAGDSVIIGIYDSIDGAGHSSGFSKDNDTYFSAAMTCDTYTYQILREIKSREEKLNEKWLIILANDHGGKDRGHGGQTLEERTTFIASNIPFDEKLLGKSYNGKTDKDYGNRYD